jgi:hypothetical protein
MNSPSISSGVRLLPMTYTAQSKSSAFQESPYRMGFSTDACWNFQPFLSPLRRTICDVTPTSDMFGPRQYVRIFGGKTSTNDASWEQPN